MHLTQHASHRSSQRNLPVSVLSIIYDYGSPVHSKGAISLTLDGQSIALAAEGDPHKCAELERYRGSYIIVGDDDRIITAARRRRRFRH